MWVKSQDNSIITNTNTLFYVKDKKRFVICCFVGEHMMELGEFVNEFEAIQVINSFINRLCELYNLTEANDVIFNIPEDSDCRAIDLRLFRLKKNIEDIVEKYAKEGAEYDSENGERIIVGASIDLLKKSLIEYLLPLYDSKLKK